MANEVFDKKPQVRFRRNSDAPLLYAPLIDVRTSQHGLHLLTYVPPAAAPSDLLLLEGDPIIDVLASSELIVPMDSVPRLIRDLAFQFRNTIIQRLKNDAAQAGIEVPDSDDAFTINGLDDIMAVAAERERLALEAEQG